MNINTTIHTKTKKKKKKKREERDRGALWGSPGDDTPWWADAPPAPPPSLILVLRRPQDETFWLCRCYCLFYWLWSLRLGHLELHVSLVYIFYIWILYVCVCELNLPLFPYSIFFFSFFIFLFHSSGRWTCINIYIYIVHKRGEYRVVYPLMWDPFFFFSLRLYNWWPIHNEQPERKAHLTLIAYVFKYFASALLSCLYVCKCYSWSRSRCDSYTVLFHMSINKKTKIFFLFLLFSLYLIFFFFSSS